MATMATMATATMGILRMVATDTTGKVLGAVQAPPLGVELGPAAKDLDLLAVHR